MEQERLEGKKRSRAQSHGEPNKKNMHFIYLFLNHVVILRNHHLLLLKGKGWFLRHTYTLTEGNEVVLLKTTDVNSRPRQSWRQIHTSPSGTTVHFTCQSFQMCCFRCTVCGHPQSAHSDPPLPLPCFHNKNRTLH